MTRSQMGKLADAFQVCMIDINAICPLAFITREWLKSNIRIDLQELVREDWLCMFGPKIARMIEDDNPDTAAELQEYGGVFCTAFYRPYDAKTVKLREDGRFASAMLSPNWQQVAVWAPDYDKMICKLVARVKHENNAIVKKARMEQCHERNS